MLVLISNKGFGISA